MNSTIKLKKTIKYIESINFHINKKPIHILSSHFVLTYNTNIYHKIVHLKIFKLRCTKS